MDWGNILERLWHRGCSVHPSLVSYVVNEYSTLPYRFLPCYTPLVARLLRLEYPGAVCHSTSRGNGRSKIFRSDEDGSTFPTVLAAVIQKYNRQPHAYCLMDNHYLPAVNLCRWRGATGYPRAGVPVIDTLW